MLHAVIYLSGVTSHRDEPALLAAGVGLMCQPGNSYDRWAGRYRCHAADNGCFADRWNEDRWLRWLEQVPRDRCLFAVAPDVVPDAAGTLDRSGPFLPILRDFGFPAALVAQNGVERLAVPWDEFDALFLGGVAECVPCGHVRPLGVRSSTCPSCHRPVTEWKEGRAAEELARQALRHGKWVHMGRVNSLRRLDRARAMGCHSADGTFIKYRRRLRAAELDDLRDTRGAGELAAWGSWLTAHQPLPGFAPSETPAHPTHRAVLA